MNANPHTARTGGFSLLDVVIGILIFTLGILALASMHGSLTRSMADANVRTVATNLAEERLERLRVFSRLETDPAGVESAYTDLQNHTDSTTIGGIVYDITVTVTDFYYDLVTDQFTQVNPEGVLVSDFKLLEVEVAWAGLPGFRSVAGTEIDPDDIGTGSITLTEFVSSVTTQGAGRTATEQEFRDLLPVVDYTPGDNPDIISLQLGNNRFKESSTPEPRVYRSEELVETRFDVITYSQTDSGAFFLRREEFVTVSCNCTLQAPPTAAEDGGRAPTTWVGDEYDLGEYQIKPFGTSASNQQSTFCNECCRDHHDGGTAPADAAAGLYNPYRASEDYWDSGTFAGDHKHYGRNNRGDLVIADSAGESYQEACRMVRVDGFMRAAQDFRQEGRNVFPENYLDEDAEVEDYSDWVTASVNTYENALSDGYESAPPNLAPPPLQPEEGGFPTYTTLPTALSATSQQLRSRGVYVDYLRDDLRTAIDCLRVLPEGGEAGDCDSDTIQFDRSPTTNVLEVIPFFDVQLTFLNRWTENPLNDPVDTTNETVRTDNAHSRGVATLETGIGESTVTASGHMGNIGLTDTDPVDFRYTEQLRSNTLQVEALTGTPVTPGNVVIQGNISSGVNGLRGTEIEVTGDNAQCNRTPQGYICEFSSSATGVRLRVSNYKKQNTLLAACSLTLARTSSGTDANGAGFAYFSLSPSPALDPSVSHDIWIQENGCS